MTPKLVVSYQPTLPIVVRKKSFPQSQNNIIISSKGSLYEFEWFWKELVVSQLYFSTRQCCWTTNSFQNRPNITMFKSKPLQILNFPLNVASGVSSFDEKIQFQVLSVLNEINCSCYEVSCLVIVHFLTCHASHKFLSRCI